MKDTNLIPLSQKIAFGIGQFANQMFPATLGIFMVVLVQDLGFDPIYWGLYFLSRGFLMRLQIQSWDLYLIILVLNGAKDDNIFC